jgi:predicted outer membrane protein
MHHRPSPPPRATALVRLARRARRSRLPARTVLALLATGTALLVPVGPAAAHEGSGSTTRVTPQNAQTSPTPTPAPSPADSGEPLAVSDVEILHKVKQAGLWEMPVGSWVSERAVNARAREVGRLLAVEHAELDEIVNTAAARLDVPLPKEPTPEQQGWMREIDAQRGAAFDERAIFLLRQAHGAVLPVLAQVRSTSRNAVIRQFTTESMEFVHRHIQYLESTGLVRFEQLPGMAELTAPGWGWNGLTYTLFALVTAVFIVLLVVVVRAVAGIGRALGRRGRRHTLPSRPRAAHHARS